MPASRSDSIARAKQAALDVLRHNATGPCQGLPRTAGWGYPEPYTRDWMIASLGILVSGDPDLLATLERFLASLARNQSEHGLIPSLAHNAEDLGASDTTPLFLIALALFRKVSGSPQFLQPAAEKALTWLSYQSPDDQVMVAQQPTSDWRDEQWVPGYGLFVNVLVYISLRLWARHEQADRLRDLMNRLDVRQTKRNRHIHEGLRVPHKPYYALWSFKLDNNERFDLLGNSLAIIAGLPSVSRARDMVSWIEKECAALRTEGKLALDLPPCLFPYVQPGEPDWRARYQDFNRPGEYHNGGVWPFVCGFYVAALAAVSRPQLARRRLATLTELVRPARDGALEFGFNEWFCAQDGAPRGQDWQTWSASMYLYAADAVESGRPMFFDSFKNAKS